MSDYSIFQAISTLPLKTIMTELKPFVPGQAGLFLDIFSGILDTVEAYETAQKPATPAVPTANLTSIK